MDLSGLTGIEREVQKFKQAAYDLLDSREDLIKQLMIELYKARGNDDNFCRCEKADPSDECLDNCLARFVSIHQPDAEDDATTTSATDVQPDDCKIKLPNLERNLKAARMRSKLAAHNSEGIPPPHRVLHPKEKKRCIRGNTKTTAVDDPSLIDLSIARIN